MHVCAAGCGGARAAGVANAGRCFLNGSAQGGGTTDAVRVAGIIIGATFMYGAFLKGRADGGGTLDVVVLCRIFKIIAPVSGDFLKGSAHGGTILEFALCGSGTLGLTNEFGVVRNGSSLGARSLGRQYLVGTCGQPADSVTDFDSENCSAAFGTLRESIMHPANARRKGNAPRVWTVPITLVGLATAVTSTALPCVLPKFFA